MLLAQAREEIAAYCHRIRRDRLAVGTAGNLSIRVADQVAITPSGLDYDAVTPGLVCVVRFADGSPVDTPLEPASELPLHLAALRATGATAVVHTHSAAATTVACIEGLTELPNVHYYAGLFGGRVAVTRYARFGTAELASTVEVALSDRNGCLLGNHGAITVGRDLAQAYDKAEQLEWMCEVFLRASAYGTPRLLSDEEIAAVARRLVAYGQKPPGRPLPVG